MLSKEQHTQLIQNVQNAKTEAERFEALTELQSNFDNDLAEFNTTQENLTNVTKERDIYRKKANEYWLQCSAEEKQNEVNDGGVETPQDFKNKLPKISSLKW